MVIHIFILKMVCLLMLDTRLQKFNTPNYVGFNSYTAICVLVIVASSQFKTCLYAINNKLRDVCCLKIENSLPPCEIIHSFL